RRVGPGPGRAGMEHPGRHRIGRSQGARLACGGGPGGPRRRACREGLGGGGRNPRPPGGGWHRDRRRCGRRTLVPGRGGLTMAGNSQRRGAIRKAKKGPTVGSGGQRRRALEGKGPTPKAEDRPNHKAYKAKRAAEAAEAKKAPRTGGKAKPTDKTSGSTELVVGRSSVLEALRGGLPATTLHVFQRIEADDRVTEIVSLAVERGLVVREVSKGSLDVLAGGSPHQGVALEVSPYEYLEPEDLLEAPSPVRIMVLDGIQDPRNLGAILRSAAAFGASGVLIPERRAAGVT